MLLSDNINRLMDAEDISNNQLGKELGLSTETIRNWRLGIKVPTVDKLLKLSEYFNVSLDALMGKTIDTEQFIDLPVVGAVSAGIFTIENEEDWKDRFQSVSLRALHGRSPKECVLLEVVGDSMEPLVHVGELVVVHRQNTAVNGNIVVIWDEAEGGYTLKTFYQDRDKVELIPANAQYKRYIYRRPEWSQLSIYGVCLSAERSLV